VSGTPLDWISAPAGPLRGVLRVPGDKSISHRSIMLAAIAEGTSHISGFLEGEDTRATARAFAQMGVRIEAPSSNERIVHGVGLHGLHAARAGADSCTLSDDFADRARRDGASINTQLVGAHASAENVGLIDCGNAGTGMRLLTGLLAGQQFDSTLIGDESLSRRPMRRVIEPLTQMGARIEAQPGGLPPLRVGHSSALNGIDYSLPVASAQVKSAILLAGLYAAGETVVREPNPTRDYTERMLATFGWPIQFGAGWAKLTGNHRLQATDIIVPSDFSSAAFFIVAATTVPGSDLLLQSVGMNPRRTGLLRALRAMGADVLEIDAREVGGEPVADLRVRAADLHGIDVPSDVVPDMIDEFPALFVAAAAASGSTRISGAAELRVKESDRIAVMGTGLRTLGIAFDESPDGAIITGGTIAAGSVDSRGDHRCAMSFAIAGLLASGPVRIRDCANVATSFPGFVELACSSGFDLR